MKKFFSLIFVICFLFIGTASAQWWVRGGNLLWPYGDVEIAKDLTVSGETTLDSNVTINGNLIVTGSISSDSVKEYIAFVIWNTNSDPTVDVIKNTLGETVTWDNVDDLGESLDATVVSNLFLVDKTSFYSAFRNAGAQNFFVYGQRTSNTSFRFTSVNPNGDAQVAIPDLEFVLTIQVYP